MLRNGLLQLMATARLKTADRLLTVWIALAMAVGLLIGTTIPSIPAALGSLQQGTTNIPLAIGLIVMMFPPLAKVRYERLPVVFSDMRLLSIAMILNWVIAPLVMFGLAVVFLQDSLSLMHGLILVGLAPCIAMVIVWNTLAKGDPEYAAGLVALNSIFQIAFFPSYAVFFLNTLPTWIGIEGVAIDLSYTTVAQSVLIYMGIPFAAGMIVRFVGVRARGREWFDRVVIPKISPITLIALLFTIVVMFTMKASMILSVPLDVVRVSIPLLIYFVALFGIGWWLSSEAHATRQQKVTLAFTAASNNFELAIAVAIAVFGIQSAEAFATVIGPLIEVPVMMGFVLLINRKSNA